MNDLKVKYSKVQIGALIILSLFFVPMAGLMFFSAATHDFQAVPLTVGAGLAGIYLIVIFLVIRAYRKSAGVFTAENLKRNDGLLLPWSDLLRVVSRLRTNPRTSGTFVWRIEIEFKNGESAWIIPGKVANCQEVINYVYSLPCEQSEKRV